MWFVGKVISKYVWQLGLVITKFGCILNLVFNTLPLITYTKVWKNECLHEYCKSIFFQSVKTLTVCQDIQFKSTVAFFCILATVSYISYYNTVISCTIFGSYPDSHVLASCWSLTEIFTIFRWYQYLTYFLEWS